MAAKSITFYFDVESPFSYIAFELLERVKYLWQVSVTYKPVFISGIFKAVGNRPPARAVPAKGKYLFQDIRRTAKLHGIPFRGLPINSLAHADTPQPFRSTPGLRLLVVALERHGSDDQRCRELIRRVFQNVMFDHRGAELQLTPEMLLADARDSGFSEDEGKALLKESEGQGCRATLKAATAEAVEEEAFGLPFMILHGDGIDARYRHWFGADSLHSLGLLLGHPLVLPSNMPSGASPEAAASLQSKL